MIQIILSFLSVQSFSMGGQAPIGWLLCDGSKVNRKNYKDLFDVIGTRFGSGDGVSTFTLPNFVNKFPKGCGSASDVGGEGGNDTVTLETKHLPSHTHNGSTDDGGVDHNHSVYGTTSDDGNHAHSFDDCYFVEAYYAGYSGCIHLDRKVKGSGDSDDDNSYLMYYTHDTHTDGHHTHDFTATCDNASAYTHNHSFTTNTTGEDTAFSIIPTNISVFYIIKY